MAITALDFMNRSALAKNTLVATVQSNMGLDACLAKCSGKVFRAAVGDKNVIDEMLAQDLNVGGEQSGHMIFRDYTTTGDGLISALQVLRIMRTNREPLSELCKCLELFPQVNINIRVKSKPSLDTMPDVQQSIHDAEAKLGKEGRLLVRYSGTEPVCRVLLEGRDGKQIEELANKIAGRIREKVGA
jgi:phosphoglucosamine mutase